jgi:2-keto-4-pentenoate hydratase/2-oxohepta-3-ene-1,7-dioic acid hydratase in catechol pathway
MKIARYRHVRTETYGAVLGEDVVNLPELAKRFNENLPETVEGFVNSGETALNAAEDILKEVPSNYSKLVSTPLDKVTLLAPLTSPSKIICLGWNYTDHAKERGAEIPKDPVIFMKPRTAIIGPNEKIFKPGFVQNLDYEAELAVIIGKKAKNVSAKEAKNCIFGYTVFNDVSARDIQFGDGQWTRGKSFDTFAPIGPWITTSNQLKDTANLAVRAWVNKERRQNGTTKNMVFNVEQIVHHLSRVMTLEPCDIIATGTPAGVGMAMNPPTWLKNGDVVKVEVEGIGILENPVEEVTD